MKSTLLRVLRRRSPAIRTRRPADPLQECAVAPEPAPVPAPLAVRLRHALDSAHSRHQVAMTPREIAAGTAALRYEGSIPVHLMQQVLDGDDGVAEGLTPLQLATLAELLGLPVAYFLGTDAEVDVIDARLELLRAMRDLRADGAIPYICGRVGALTAPRARAYSDLLRRTPQLLAEHGISPARPPNTE